MSAARKCEDRDRADSGGLLRILGEAVVLSGLLGKNSLAFLTDQVSYGYGVGLSPNLDDALAGRGQVVVPIRMRWKLLVPRSSSIERRPL